MPDLTGRRYRFHYVTAVNLLDVMGVPLENILVRAVGRYENYRGEVRTQDPEPGAPLDSRTIITLEAGCDSAVDYMPYQFFYGLGGLRDTDSSWEEAARDLMAPFDSAMVRREAATTFHALRHSLGVVDEGHLRRFMALFEFDPDEVEAGVDEMMFIASLLPSLNRWAGNAEVVESVLRRLFGYDFRIIENVPNVTGIPEEIRYRLGSRTARLGYETVTGGSFVERDSTYEVRISGVPVEDIRELIPGGRKIKRIEYFSPQAAARRGGRRRYVLT